MPKFSNSSYSKLSSCHPDLQRLFNEVIRHWDCTIIFGHRSPAEQNDLFMKGRAIVDGKVQIVDSDEVVTYRDGYEKISLHNELPALAVDVMPYFSEEPHIRWTDIDSLQRFGHYVKGMADGLNIEIEWGGDWRSFKDYPHYQIKQ